MSCNVPTAIIGWLIFLLGCGVGYAGYQFATHLF